MSVKFFGRTRARSQALQLLFQAEATNRSVLEVLDGDYTLSEGPLDEYAQSLAVGADGIRDDLDDIIAAYSKDWAIDRMPSVDRNLLRISLYEILEVPEVDVAVAINEVVDLARAYCGDDSPRFINGVLGRIVDDIEAGEDIYSLCHKQSAEQDVSEEESVSSVEDAE